MLSNAAVAAHNWAVVKSLRPHALLNYSTLPGASSTAVNAIRSHKRSSMNGSDFFGAWTASTEALSVAVRIASARADDR